MLATIAPLYSRRCVYQASTWRGEPNVQQLKGQAGVCCSLDRPAPPGLAARCIAVPQTKHLSPFLPCAAALQEPFWALQSRPDCSSAAAQWHLDPVSRYMRVPVVLCLAKLLYHCAETCTTVVVGWMMAGSFSAFCYGESASSLFFRVAHLHAVQMRVSVWLPPLPSVQLAAAAWFVWPWKCTGGSSACGWRALLRLMFGPWQCCYISVYCWEHGYATVLMAL